MTRGPILPPLFVNAFATTLGISLFVALLKTYPTGLPAIDNPFAMGPITY